ncbi:MAG: 1,4-dihydroxy-2-naphthoate polyprenyltransferase [Simkaniaceae bacterium]|nr:1,4-dihydroxy-2-naphthoate polyprenyltransferase [Simkaniaceae bacterium]
MNIWIEGARPNTLIASLSPVSIGGAIAFEQKSFPIAVFLVCIIFALTVQIGTNFANDYIDFLKGTDTPKRKGPRRLVQVGLVSPQKMRKVTFGVFGIAALAGLYLMLVGGWQIGLLALLAILLGYLYTGGPYPLGYLGLGDLFVFIFFGPIATCGVVYLMTGEMSSIALFAGLSPGLLSTAILVMNNLRDYESDKQAHKKSLPVRFGMRFGRWEFALCIFLGILTPVILFGVTRNHPWSLTATATLGLGIPLVKNVFNRSDPKSLAPLFPKVGKLLTLYTLLFILGWVF